MLNIGTQGLQAFITAAETGSFSEAAEKLHLTQPAISKRIASIEQQLNVRLFDRINRRVVLTESGSLFLPRARQLLHDIEATERAVSDIEGTVRGKLSIAISHHIGLHRLPPVLKNYSRLYPEVSLDIRFTDSELAYEAVQRGEIELAVITLSPEGNPPIQANVVWRDPLVFVCSHDHPLRSQGPVSMGQLSQFNAILPGQNTYTGKIANALFQQRGITINTSMETNYLETIHMMVSIGLGWSLLPLTMVGDLYAIPLKEKQLMHAIGRELGVISHHSKSLSGAGKAFKQLLLAEAE